VRVSGIKPLITPTKLELSATKKFKISLSVVQRAKLHITATGNTTAINLNI
jgi:hypothetical protein